MTKERRLKILHNMGIITLVLISLYFINELFGQQLSIFKSAVNSIILPFGIALFLSYLLQPLVNILENRLKSKSRIVNIIIVFIVVILAGAGFLFLVGDIIYKQGVSFIEKDLDNILSWVNNLIANNPEIQETYNTIVQHINFETFEPIVVNGLNFFKGIGSFVVIIVLIPVFLFFLLKEKQTIFNGIVSVLPQKYQLHATELGIRANFVIQKYFNGRFLSMFIMSILLTIMFMVFGFSFERALFFGFVLGFLDIIPYIGTFIGMLLPILYSFTVQDSLWLGEWTFVGLIAVNAVLQGFQGNILQPIIMGKEVNLHPLLVLVSFIFFGALFGISGVILAIPITGILKTTVEYFRQLNELEMGSKKASKKAQNQQKAKAV